MIVFSIFLAASPLAPIIKAPAPPLEAEGWELVWETKETRHRRVFVNPTSVRPISRNDSFYAVTIITEFRNADDEWRFVTMGFVVDCDTKEIRQDWHFIDRNGRSLITYSSSKFRTPGGSQVKIVERTCELS